MGEEDWLGFTVTRIREEVTVEWGPADDQGEKLRLEIWKTHTEILDNMPDTPALSMFVAPAPNRNGRAQFKDFRLWW